MCVSVCVCASLCVCVCTAYVNSMKPWHMTNCSVAWRVPIALGCRRNVTYTHCRVCTLLWLTHEQLSLTPAAPFFLALLPPYPLQPSFRPPPSSPAYVSTTCLACLAPYELQSVWPIFGMSESLCACACVCACVRGVRAGDKREWCPF